MHLEKKPERSLQDKVLKMRAEFGMWSSTGGSVKFRILFLRNCEPDRAEIWDSVSS